MTFARGSNISTLEKWGKIPAGSTVVYLENCDCQSLTTLPCSFIVVEFKGEQHWVPQKAVGQCVRKSWFDIWGR